MKIKIVLFRICQILCIIAFFLLLSHSDLVLYYAREGIRTWACSVLPVLIPFIILSRFWIYYEVPGLLFRSSQKMLVKHTSFALAATILFLGLTSGFPVGAIFIKYFYDRRILTKDAAEELLPLCSFVSPMFLIGYVRPLTGYKGIAWILFLCSLYLPLLFCFGNGIRSGKIHAYSGKNESFSSGKSSIRDIWIYSLEVIFTIGIYMMLFSILFGLAIHQPLFRKPFMEILLGNLEITVGIGWIARMSTIKGIVRGMILAASVSFGGLCTMAQVYTILSESNLSLKCYVMTKGKTALLSAIILLFFFLFFKIFFAAGSFGSIS